MGFHADPSDVEIAFELLHLAHDIEFVIAALLVGHTFAQHEHTYLITFFNANIGQTVDLTVIRDGNTVIVPLTLGSRP